MQWPQNTIFEGVTIIFCERGTRSAAPYYYYMDSGISSRVCGVGVCVGGWCWLGEGGGIEEAKEGLKPDRLNAYFLLFGEHDRFAQGGARVLRPLSRIPQSVGLGNR